MHFPDQNEANEAREQQEQAQAERGYKRASKKTLKQRPGQPQGNKNTSRVHPREVKLK